MIFVQNAAKSIPNAPPEDDGGTAPIRLAGTTSGESPVFEKVVLGIIVTAK